MAKKIYGLSAADKKLVKETIARSVGGFKRRRPTNKRRRFAGGGDSGNVIIAQVNKAGGMLRTNATAPFDNAVAIVGSAPEDGTGTITNQYYQAMADDRIVALIQSKATGNWLPVPPLGDIVYAQVNKPGGVTTSDSTFPFDNAVPLIGSAPTNGTGTAQNNRGLGTGQQKFSDNQWVLLFKRPDSTEWVVERWGGGGDMTPVAITSSITAATAAIVSTRSTVTKTTVTAKSMEFDSSGNPYYDTATATSVTCYWCYGTGVTINSSKYKIGWMSGDKLITVDCEEYEKP